MKNPRAPGLESGGARAGWTGRIEKTRPRFAYTAPVRDRVFHRFGADLFLDVPRELVGNSRRSRGRPRPGPSAGIELQIRRSEVPANTGLSRQAFSARPRRANYTSGARGRPPSPRHLLRATCTRPIPAGRAPCAVMRPARLVFCGQAEVDQQARPVARQPHDIRGLERRMDTPSAVTCAERPPATWRTNADREPLSSLPRRDTGRAPLRAVPCLCSRRATTPRPHPRSSGRPRNFGEATCPARCADHSSRVCTPRSAFHREEGTPCSSPERCKIGKRCSRVRRVVRPILFRERKTRFMATQTTTTPVVSILAPTRAPQRDFLRLVTTAPHFTAPALVRRSDGKSPQRSARSPLSSGCSVAQGPIRAKFG